MTGDRVYLTLLLDVYGELLTPRQREIMALRYDEDLSLSEIGDLSGGSRQGVWDTLRRAEEALLGFEETLGLLKRLARARSAAGELLRLLGELETRTDPEAGELFDRMRAQLAVIQEQLPAGKE